MKWLSLFLTVCLVAYTALAMVYHDTFPWLQVAQVGGAQLHPFDLVFYPTVLVLLFGLVRHRTAPLTPVTRLAVYVVVAYAVYQILVVLPIMVVLSGYSPLGAFYALRPRLSMILVVFFALLVTRRWSGDVVSRILEWAALALVVVAAWRFLTGAQVEVEFATGRFRVMWGGSTLLFGWLVISRFLKERLRPRDVMMTVAGLAGIVLVNHRSAYIALAVALLAYVFARKRHAVRTIGIMAGVVILGVVVVLTFLPDVQESLNYSFHTLVNPQADANTIDRVEKTRLSFQTFAKYPFGDIMWRSSGYYLVDLGASEWTPHNFVAQLLAGEGVVGFLAWITLILASLAVAFRNARRDSRSATLGAYLLFYLVFCLFNTNFYADENIVLLASAMGLVFWRDRVVQVRAHEPCGSLAEAISCGRKPQGLGDTS
jgi:hypothetical protein